MLLKYRALPLKSFLHCLRTVQKSPPRIMPSRIHRSAPCCSSTARYHSKASFTVSEQSWNTIGELLEYHWRHQLQPLFHQGSDNSTLAPMISDMRLKGCSAPCTGAQAPTWQNSAKRSRLDQSACCTGRPGLPQALVVPDEGSVRTPMRYCKTREAL